MNAVSLESFFRNDRFRTVYRPFNVYLRLSPVSLLGSQTLSTKTKRLTLTGCSAKSLLRKSLAKVIQRTTFARFMMYSPIPQTL